MDPRPFWGLVGNSLPFFRKLRKIYARIAIVILLFIAVLLLIAASSRDSAPHKDDAEPSAELLGKPLHIVVYFSGRIVRPFAESYEKQKQFITDAGHEIKTPLAIIQADADVLEMELGENEWLAEIQAHVKQLSGLTNDLFSLARMEEGRAPLQILEIPISDLISEAGESFQSLAQTQGKVIQLAVAPMLSMEADEKALRQLVNILLDNALKYSPEGGSIRLSLEKQGKLLKLTVSNPSLVPLPEENLDRLFDRFYRADPSRNSQTGGHGIGLSIAKAIVTAHGGQIHASIAENNALHITATLPQKQPANIMRSQARKVP